MHARIAFASSFNVHEREDLVEGKVTTSSYPPLWITRIITARRALMNAAPWSPSLALLPKQAPAFIRTFLEVADAA
jgi:hypothetical protein